MILKISLTLTPFSFRFDSQIAPNQRIFRFVLDVLRSEDPEQYFEYPVNPEFAPGYVLHIRLGPGLGPGLGLRSKVRVEVRIYHLD